MGGKDPEPRTEEPREGPESDEVLDVGQEEVFSRAEVELGRIEHATEAGRERREKRD